MIIYYILCEKNNFEVSKNLATNIVLKNFVELSKWCRTLEYNE